MKSSNLALRLELEEEFAQSAAEQAAAEAAARERHAAALKLRKSFDYRAIEIRDPGLRLFRVG